MEPKVIRNGEAQVLMEGEEFTQLYFHTDKLLFSIGNLLPGQRAVLDKGHKESDEICYVIQGKLVMHLANLDKYYLLNEGDAILIPPGEPHYSINVGDEKAITAWATAPKL